MSDRVGAVSVRGTPLTLVGDEVRPGDAAPDAELSGPGFFPKPVKLSDYRGKVVLLSAVPSLDTPTCDRETRRWEQERAALGDQLEMLTVSMDLPFAQQRWCGVSEVNHTVASAFRNPQFGVDYGALIKENGLLARSIFVIGKDGRVKYVEYVKDVATEPDYAAALAAAREAAAE